MYPVKHNIQTLKLQRYTSNDSTKAYIFRLKFLIYSAYIFWNSLVGTYMYQ